MRRVLRAFVSNGGAIEKSLPIAKVFVAIAIFPPIIYAMNIPSFDSPKAALAWLASDDSLEYSDNFRFAFLDNEGSVRSFEKIARRGCCGSEERDCVVRGRAAIVGCNFGH